MPRLEKTLWLSIPVVKQLVLVLVLVPVLVQMCVLLL
jgi:hypothetical protein